MTYENCIKYKNEAKNEKDKVFWDERIKRKYPEKIVVKEEVKPKPKATPKLKSIKKIVSTPKSTKERK